MAFNGMTLTTLGVDLQTKIQAGTTAAFTKIKLGDGTLPVGGTLEALTDLVSPKLIVNIESVTSQGDGTWRVRGTLTNTGLATGFFVREVGLFATDPDEGEILYSVANAGSECDYLPAGGGAVVVEQVIDIVVAISSSATVTATINEPAVFVSLALFNEHVNDTSIHKNNQFQIYTTPGTHTFVAPVDGYYDILVVGAGAGGGGAKYTSNVAVSGSGGGGGYARKRVYLNKSETITVTVGAGGTPGTNTPTIGGNGGTSSFGAHCSATGGIGGSQANGTAGSGVTNGLGGRGGYGTGGDINGNGWGGRADSVDHQGSSAFGPPGGASILSGGALPADNAPGNNGVLGEGGSGADAWGVGAAYAGGRGGDGVVGIWW